VVFFHSKAKNNPKKPPLFPVALPTLLFGANPKLLAAKGVKFGQF